MNSDKRSPTAPEEEHDILSDQDAEASSPEDSSVCGEEDPGVALEEMVRHQTSGNE
ncbi:hypothetical protein OPS25_02640 [Alteromonas ponticola]|uniref:Uncharacterized protein n=1 Tax=Alteromonas aquimaris TaxID=2998417 RepID=A0ABT3P3R0_9ALTE|nr:hypothetical protein [Alteromonas aquimaris]MCW8107399.1 hypothetical protein [Alteromonas aquimaris]